MQNKNFCERNIGCIFIEIIEEKDISKILINEMRHQVS